MIDGIVSEFCESGLFFGGAGAVKDDEEVVVVGVKAVACFSGIQDLQRSAGEVEVGGS